VGHQRGQPSLFSTREAFWYPPAYGHGKPSNSSSFSYGWKSRPLPQHRLTKTRSSVGYRGVHVQHLPSALLSPTPVAAPCVPQRPGPIAARPKEAARRRPIPALPKDERVPQQPAVFLATTSEAKLSSASLAPCHRASSPDFLFPIGIWSETS